MEGVYGQGGGGRKEVAGKGEGVQCVQGEGRDGHEVEGEDGHEVEGEDGHELEGEDGREEEGEDACHDKIVERTDAHRYVPAFLKFQAFFFVLSSTI